MIQQDAALDRGILQAIAVFRWLAAAWAIIGVVIARSQLIRPAMAIALLAAAAAFSAAATWFVAVDPERLLTPPMVLVELALGAGLLIGDGFVYEPVREQSLPWAWPAAAIITAAVAFGPWWGLLAALVSTAASTIGETLLFGFDWSLSDASKGALWVLAALGAGYTSRRLREAEQEISTARAREQMARTLHDGVLQTLAVVQRRASDDDLVELARDQERDLRAFLFDTNPDRLPLEIALREAADLVARRHGIATQAIVADDLPPVADDVADALAGAATEAMTNAAKHSGGSKIILYAEPDPDDESRVFCSVNDDGEGFDTAAPPTGEGIARSIHARIGEVGGTVEISSRPGRGTEVNLWAG